jgi:WD40 repeat protein
MIRMLIVKLLFVTLFTLLLLVAPSSAQNTDDQLLKFEPKHRVNAHGNEFNGLAKSSDGKRLFIATEKGEIIVWNIGSRQPERTFHQTSPVHFVAALPESSEILAAGSNHLKPLNVLVRKWNFETGEFVDLVGLDQSSLPTALATETQTQLAAVATDDGTVVAWDLGTNKQLATWKLKETPIALALMGRNVYVATIDRNAISSGQGIDENAIIKLNVDDPKQPPAEFLRVPKRLWTGLAASPDHRLLSATSQSRGQERTSIIEPATKANLGNFAGSASLWVDPSKLVLFTWLDPSEIVQVPRRGPAKSIRQIGRPQSDTEGRAFDLTGQVANADGSRIWASYSKGPGLLEFDLATNRIRTLIQGPSGAYSISVSDQNSDAGQILTGGADGYVRLWKLADLSLVKEFHVAASGYFVSDVHLLADARRAIVGVMRIRDRTEPMVDLVEVLLLDLETGQRKKLLDVKWWRARIAIVDDRIVYPKGDRVKLAAPGNIQDTRELKADSLIVATAVSANRRWLAVADDKSNLTVFDLLTLQKKTIATQSGDWGTFVVTNDGRYVYRIANEGELTTWDLNTAQMSQSVLARIREMHSNVDFMTLVNDDEWLVTAGNHGDVGVFDRTTGRLVSYTRSSSAAFYVEKVWIQGNRLIFTTDTGVMVDGNLVLSKN